MSTKTAFRGATLRALLLGAAVSALATAAVAAETASAEQDGTAVSSVTVQGAKREEESKSSYKITRSTPT